LKEAEDKIKKEEEEKNRVEPPVPMNIDEVEQSTEEDIILPG